MNRGLKTAAEFLENRANEFPDNITAQMMARIYRDEAASIRALPVVDWVPIEEAPVDEELVCWCPGIGIRVLYREEDEVYWRLAGVDTDDGYDDYEPTHFMPNISGPE